MRPFLMWVFPLLFFAYQFILRLAPGLALQEVTSKFGVDATAFGFSSAAYYFGYAGMQIPVAFLLDRLGSRKVIPICVILSSAATFLFAHTQHWSFVLIARFMVGAGSAAGFLGTSRVISLWFNHEQYAKWIGITFGVGLVGAFYGGRPIASLMSELGWIRVFDGMAWLGIVLAVTIFVFLREPVQSNRAVSEGFTGSIGKQLWAVIQNPKIVIMAFCSLLMVGSLEGFADMWGVSYLASEYPFTKQQAAFLVSFIFMGMQVGGPLLAWFASRFQAYYEVTAATGFLTAFIFASFLLFPHSFGFNLLAGGFFWIGIFCCYQVLIFAMGSFLVSEENRGVAVAFLNCISMLGGSFFHSAIGWIVDRYGQGSMQEGVWVYHAHAYAMGLWTIPCSAVLGASILFSLRPPRVNTKTTSALLSILILSFDVTACRKAPPPFISPESSTQSLLDKQKKDEPPVPPCVLTPHHVIEEQTGGDNKVVTLGDIIPLGDQKWAVGVLREQKQGGRIGSVVLVSSEEGPLFFFDLGFAYGDIPPPRPMQINGELYASFYIQEGEWNEKHTASKEEKNRILALFHLKQGEKSHPLISFAQSYDESFAYSMALHSSSSGLVVWDEDIDAGRKGSLQMSLFHQDPGKGEMKMVKGTSFPLAKGDVDFPLVALRPQGYWIFWIARRTERVSWSQSLREAGDSPRLGELSYYSWLEVAAIGEKGGVVQAARPLTSMNGRVEDFQVWPLRNGEVLDVWVRENPEPFQESGRILRIQMELGKEAHQSVVLDKGVGRNRIVLLGDHLVPKWLAYADLTNHFHLLSVHSENEGSSSFSLDLPLGDEAEPLPILLKAKGKGDRSLRFLAAFSSPQERRIRFYTVECHVE
ncbi:hypothetical protein BCY86_01875 [Pajaroellobacter abortibovis]|uniref:Major facilitator superfamily (MFS) profile domain-containing protein n=2 Tax=Pajaroellobacter abortibovis TaxID=1882918 RepID=A0A1L6MVL6_9BACT|nr:hypothetical protein BCY86_01875 [Pajaroellobacter abortibovis]